MTSTPETPTPTADAAPARPAFEPVPAAPTLEQIRLAQAALDEVAPAGTVGDAVDALQTDEHVVEIRFVCSLDGYPDWYWTASLATVEADRPTVMELALLPGDTSLLAPEWVPWDERLAEFLAVKEAEEAAGDSEDDADDDEADDDFDDFDDPDASPYSDTGDEPFSPEDAEGEEGDDDEEDEGDDD